MNKFNAKAGMNYEKMLPKLISTSKYFYFTIKIHTLEILDIFLNVWKVHNTLVFLGSSMQCAFQNIIKI